MAGSQATRVLKEMEKEEELVSGGITKRLDIEFTHLLQREWQR